MGGRGEGWKGGGGKGRSREVGNVGGILHWGGDTGDGEGKKYCRERRWHPPLGIRRGEGKA